jgi:aspartyl-tRNA(Asn)/glutamyl-tRNA(Gln) amidotransferase subunit A
MGSTSETSVYGAPKNPRDITRVTGGSSGGGAAAVCAHLAAYALGSDTGGSIRQPAAYCGVVGFKPTYGGVSRYGLIAYGSSLDQIGPITTSVTDAAIVYDAIKGEDKRDMTSAPVSNEPTTLKGEVKGVKVGIVKEFFEGLNPEIKNSIGAYISRIERDGAIVEEVSIPTIKAALPVYYIIACAEASSNLGRYDGIRYGFRAKEYSSVDDMVIKTRTQGFGKEVQKRIMLGTYVLSSGYFDAYYKKACILRERVKADFEKVFEKYDFLIAPTAPNCAYPLGYTQNNAIEMYLSDICTVPANICGLPAISIPCGISHENLPIGMQIIGSKFSDSKLLSFAYYFEKEGVCDIEEVKGGVKL